MTIVCLADLVDRRNIRMVECRRCLRFSYQPFACGRIDRGTRGQELESGHPPESTVPGCVHDPHSAAAQLGNDLEIADSVARRERCPFDVARVDGEMCKPADSVIEQISGTCVCRQQPVYGSGKLRIVSGLVADQLMACVGKGLEHTLEDLRSPLPAGRIEWQPI